MPILDTAVPRRPAEPLEVRRLLAADFDSGTGVLELTSGDQDVIFQFEALDGGDRFRVVQTTGDGSPPRLERPEDAGQLLDYLADADNRRTFGPYDADDVSYARVRTGGGDDLIIVGNSARVAVDVDAGDGDDTISGGPRADTIVGNLGDDYLFGGGGDDNLAGGTGDDLILGGAGDRDAVDYRTRAANEPVTVTLDGRANDGAAGERDDVGLDVEVLVGGNGNDVLDARARPASIFARGGTLRVLPPVGLYGGPGGDDLFGTALGDTLAGGEGADSLVAGAGDDLLLSQDADAGDTLVSGEGDDTVIADPPDVLDDDPELRLAPDEVLDAPETAARGSRVDDDGLITVTAGDADESIFVTADGDSLFVRVVPRGLADGVETSDVYDLNPDDRDDEITGLVVVAGAGDDLVFVGDFETRRGGAVPATLLGGLGDDTLVGGEGDDRLDAGDLLRGASGRNLLFGGGGDDTLVGGFGPDYLSGGRGDDLLDYRTRRQGVRVGLGGLFDDGLPGEGDNALIDIERLAGTRGRDRLSTTAGRPVQLFGDRGDDTLVGNAGADTIVGGPGRDELIGFGGPDFFSAVDGETDTISGGTGNDDGDFDASDIGNFGADG